MIKEFIHERHGLIRARFIDDVPYLNYKDLTKVFAIRNSKDLRSRLNGSFFKEVKETKGDVIKTVYYVSFDSLLMIFHNSKLKEADLILDWLFRIVRLKLEKLKSYDFEKLRETNEFVKLLSDYDDLKIKNSVLEASIKINRPKLKAYEELTGTKSAIDIDSVLDVIPFKRIDRGSFYKILRDKGVLDSNNIAIQEYCDRGMFRVVESKVISKHNNLIILTTFVYKSGITLIERILKEYV